MKRRADPRIAQLCSLFWALTSALPAAAQAPQEAEAAELDGTTADSTPATEQARAHLTIVHQRMHRLHEAARLPRLVPRVKPARPLVPGTLIVLQLAQLRRVEAEQ